MSLFLVYSIVDGFTDGTGQDRITQLKSEYDNYMEFLMVASQQMAGNDSVIVLMVLVIVRSKSVETFSPNGNEPAPITSVALAAQYLNCIASVS